MRVVPDIFRVASSGWWLRGVPFGRRAHLLFLEQVEPTVGVTRSVGYCFCYFLLLLFLYKFLSQILVQGRVPQVVDLLMNLILPCSVLILIFNRSDFV